MAIAPIYATHFRTWSIRLIQRLCVGVIEWVFPQSQTSPAVPLQSEPSPLSNFERDFPLKNWGRDRAGSRVSPRQCHSRVNLPPTPRWTAHSRTNLPLVKFSREFPNSTTELSNWIRELSISFKDLFFSYSIQFQLESSSIELEISNSIKELFNWIGELSNYTHIESSVIELESQCLTKGLNVTMTWFKRHMMKHDVTAASFTIFTSVSSVNDENKNLYCKNMIRKIQNYCI